MRAVLQRVKEASVTVDGSVVGAIGPGLMVLLGVGKGDTDADVAIVSHSDPQGRITFVNDDLLRVSGFSAEELIGEHHNMLRHPDMPAVAFKGLWDDVAAGKKWHGYVKNLRKDGSHYWVYATAVPNIRNGQTVGYTSVRRKPSRKKIEELSAVYKEWKAAEGST